VAKSRFNDESDTCEGGPTNGWRGTVSDGCPSRKFGAGVRVEILTGLAWSHHSNNVNSLRIYPNGPAPSRWWEPARIEITAAARLDYDGDGVSDEVERAHSSDPYDPSSH